MSYDFVFDLNSMTSGIGFIRIVAREPTTTAVKVLSLGIAISSSLVSTTRVK